MKTALQSIVSICFLGIMTSHCQQKSTQPVNVKSPQQKDRSTPSSRNQPSSGYGRDQNTTQLGSANDRWGDSYGNQGSNNVSGGYSNNSGAGPYNTYNPYNTNNPYNIPDPGSGGIGFGGSANYPAGGVSGTYQGNYDGQNYNSPSNNGINSNTATDFTNASPGELMLRVSQGIDGRISFTPNISITSMNYRLAGSMNTTPTQAGGSATWAASVAELRAAYVYQGQIRECSARNIQLSSNAVVVPCR